MSNLVGTYTPSAAELMVSCTNQLLFQYLCHCDIPKLHSSKFCINWLGLKADFPWYVVCHA